MTVRLDLLQAGVIAVVRDLAPSATVVWAPSEYPRGTSDLVAVKLLAGPSSTRPVHVVDEDPVTATITVTDAAEGQRLSVDCQGARVTLEVGAGDTDEDVRDALQALLEADIPGTPATIAPVSTDAISLTAAYDGALWGLSVSGSALTLATPSTQWIHAVTHHCVSTIEIQCFGTSRTPRSGAASLASTIVGGLYSYATRALYERYGLALWGEPGPIVDLTAISGAGWESRASFTLQLAQRSYQAREADVIERAVLDLTVDEIAVEVDVEE